LSVTDHSFADMQLGDKSFKFEVVNTEQSTSQGLSNRSEIGSDGLFFAFPQTGFQRFWMKEMLFDLDIIWLKDLQVVGVKNDIDKQFKETLGLGGTGRFETFEQFSTILPKILSQKNVSTTTKQNVSVLYQSIVNEYSKEINQDKRKRDE
jgi:hypothetical protein